MPRWPFLFREAHPGPGKLLLVVSRWHMMVGFLAISVVFIGNPSPAVIRRWWGRGPGESRKRMHLHAVAAVLSFACRRAAKSRWVGFGSPLYRAFLFARRLSLTAPPLASLPGKDHGRKSPCRHTSPALASRDRSSFFFRLSTCLRFASPQIGLDTLTPLPRGCGACPSQYDAAGDDVHHPSACCDGRQPRMLMQLVPNVGAG
ncbi:hypothetical protein HDV57DRAFT_81892 [Trichoderma longibrachiatum]